MARRRRKAKTRSRPKYKGAVNLKTAAFSYLTLSTMTNAVGNLAPVPFFLGGFMGSNFFGSATGGASNKITFIELVRGSTLGTGNAVVRPVMEDLKINLRQNAGQALATLVGIKVADKVITKLGVSRSFNRTVRSVGMGNLVKM